MYVHVHVHVYVCINTWNILAYGPCYNTCTSTCRQHPYRSMCPREVFWSCMHDGNCILHVFQQILWGYSYKLSIHNSIMQRQWLSFDTCLLPTCVMGSPLICCACGGYSSLSNLQRPHPGADVGKPSSSHSLPAPPTIVRDGLVPSSSIISPTTSSKLIRSPSFNGSVCRAMTHFHYSQSYQL